MDRRCQDVTDEERAPAVVPDGALADAAAQRRQHPELHHQAPSAAALDDCFGVIEHERA